MFTLLSFPLHHPSGPLIAKQPAVTLEHTSHSHHGDINPLSCCSGDRLVLSTPQCRAVLLQAFQILRMQGVFQSFLAFAHLSFFPKLYNFFPSVIKYFPGSHQTVIKNGRLMKRFVCKKISKHKEDLSPSESRDFIDSYLQEMAKVSNVEQGLPQWGLEIRRAEKQIKFPT